MSEPDYIRQFGYGAVEDDRDFVRKAVLPEAVAAGCTWFRTSWDDPTRTIVVEGWLKRPDDEGEPRFQMTPATPERTAQ